MTEETLRGMILDDLDGRLSDNLRAWLRSPEHLEEWGAGLTALKNAIDSELATLKAQFMVLASEMQGRMKRPYFNQARGQYELRRSEKIQRKAAVERHLAEFKALRRQLLGQENTYKKDLRELVLWAQRLIPNQGEGARWHEEARERVQGTDAKRQGQV